MKTNQTLIGILGGVAIGTVLGVLFAPDKGSKTREKIAEKGTDVAHNLKDKVNTIVKSSTEKYNSFLNKGKELKERELNDIKIKNIKSINRVLES